MRPSRCCASPTRSRSCRAASRQTPRTCRWERKPEGRQIKGQELDFPQNFIPGIVGNAVRDSIGRYNLGNLPT